ncbi:oligosaccharide flippase family protein [Marinicrinis lubricantis]|uniref:Oligosaccharide flippase family protein n=1 Tax=Marinicrinis lubricantis TaxID=2086470 RepID=A0ABW1IRB6_9BACL
MKEHIPSRVHPAASLLRGAAVLGAAAMVSKLLGVLQKVPLQNIGGDEAFGIYSIVYPFYTLILFLATAGFPVAVSKFVADSVSVGDTAEAGRILRHASIFLSITGFIFFAFLYFGADLIGTWIGNRHTVPAIQSVAFALWFVPLMSVLRGYFQGMQNMIPTAVSQVWEQLLRVTAMVVFLYYTTSRSMSSDMVAAGATLGSAVGALTGLLVMLYYRLKEKRSIRLSSRNHLDVMKEKVHPPLSSVQLFRKLMAYAIPVCLGAVVVPILNIVDTFSLPRLLAVQGFSEQQAVEQYGVYARGLPLMQMVSMLFSSMSVAIVPAIAESKAKKDWGGLSSRVGNSLRISWIIGLASSAGLALLSMPVNVMLYKDAVGTWTIFLLAWTIAFSVLNIVTSSVLQGLDAVKIPALHLLAAAGVKVLLNVLWVPHFGIRGAALSAVLSFVTAAALNVIYLARRNYIQIRFKDDLWKPIASTVVMAAAVWGWKEGVDYSMGLIWPDLSARVTATAVTLTSVLMGALVYGMALIKLGVLNRDQLNMIPLIGNKLAAKELK